MNLYFPHISISVTVRAERSMKAESNEVLVMTVMVVVSVKSGIALQIGNKYYHVTSCKTAVKPELGGSLSWATNQMLGPRASLSSLPPAASTTSTTFPTFTLSRPDQQ